MLRKHVVPSGLGGSFILCISKTAENTIKLSISAKETFLHIQQRKMI